MATLMPADIKEKEKIVKGILTLEQTFWIVGGGVVGVVCGFLVGALCGVGVGLVIGIAMAFSGVPFAFIRLYKMSLLAYLIESFKFKRKKKILTKY